MINRNKLVFCYYAAAILLALDKYNNFWNKIWMFIIEETDTLFVLFL